VRDFELLRTGHKMYLLDESRATDTAAQERTGPGDESLNRRRVGQGEDPRKNGGAN